MDANRQKILAILSAPDFHEKFTELCNVLAEKERCEDRRRLHSSGLIAKWNQEAQECLAS